MCKKVTATVGIRDSRRVSLPKPSWEGQDEVGTGVYLTGIYVSPRSTPPRIVLRYYSAWQQRSGGVRGTFYELYEPGSDVLNGHTSNYADVLQLCDKRDVEIPDVLETAEPL